MPLEDIIKIEKYVKKHKKNDLLKYNATNVVIGHYFEYFLKQLFELDITDQIHKDNLYPDLTKNNDIYIECKAAQLESYIPIKQSQFERYREICEDSEIYFALNYYDTNKSNPEKALKKIKPKSTFIIPLEIIEEAAIDVIILREKGYNVSFKFKEEDVVDLFRKKNKIWKRNKININDYNISKTFIPAYEGYAIYIMQQKNSAINLDKILKE